VRVYSKMAAAAPESDRQNASQRCEGKSDRRGAVGGARETDGDTRSARRDGHNHLSRSLTVLWPKELAVHLDAPRGIVQEPQGQLRRRAGLHVHEFLLWHPSLNFYAPSRA